MAENPETRLNKLEQHIRRNSDQLTQDGGVAGTELDMGIVEKLRFATQFGHFKQNCAKELEAGNSCTGTFNIAGKRVNVEISMPDFASPAQDRADIVINNPAQPNAIRKVSFISGRN